jgi:hypothetical protein
MGSKRVNISAMEEWGLLHFQPFSKGYFHFFIILGCPKMDQMRVCTGEIILKNIGAWINEIYSTV